MVEPLPPLSEIALSIELIGYLIVAQALADKLSNSQPKIFILRVIAHLSDDALLDRKHLQSITAPLLAFSVSAPAG